MHGADQFVHLLGRWPRRLTLGLAVVWGLGAGWLFALGQLESAWLLFIGGYQTILLLAAGVTVLRGLLLRRGEWRQALLLGVGTMAGATTLYLVAVALASANAPAGLVELASGAIVRRKPDMLITAPGFYLASAAVGTVLGPGLLLFSPRRDLAPRWRLRLPAIAAPPPVYRAAGSPFDGGPLNVLTMRVAAGRRGAPTPLVIHAPSLPGEYPAVLFLHGTLLRPEDAGTVLRRLASHGFAVVAPRLPSASGLGLATTTVLAEAELAARVVAWMRDGLPGLVPARPDLLGLAGHSRGAEVAWWLMRRGQLGALAVAAVDPVASPRPADAAARTPDEAFHSPAPALVIGAELGPMAGPLRSPCAPAGRNHQQFFAGCAAPAWHAVLVGHGHLDMLDDDALPTRVARGLCPGGPDRSAARAATAGLLAAFFRSALQGDAAAAAALASPRADAPLRVTAR